MVHKIIAIDPGSKESAFVVWDGNHDEITAKDKISNLVMLLNLRSYSHIGFPLIIEGINPYSIGIPIRDTLLWSGRFQEAWESKGFKVYYLKRDDVRQNLCGKKGSSIGDKHIRQALADRFAPYEKNWGKGTKKAPGFFYGFSSDHWSAMGLAVTYFDLNFIHGGN